MTVSALLLVTACQQPVSSGAKKVTVAYRPGSADAGQPPVDPRSYDLGSNIVVLGNTGNLGRSGYTFAGWVAGAGAAGPILVPGQTIDAAGANLTLYPAWTANSYTVRFDPAGGMGTMAEQPAVFGTTFPLSTNAFTRTGYSFAGWNTSRQYSGTAYADGGMLTMVASDVLLYAQWSPLNNTVVLNGNGGTGSMADQTVPTGRTVSLSGNAFRRDGYHFAGWNTESLGSGTSYGNYGSFTMGVTSVTLYAQWTADSMTISFNNNRGDGTMETIRAATDSPVHLPTSTMTMLGHSFEGWATSSNGPVVYGDGHTIAMPPANSTLFAVWKPNVYQISFDGNWGVGGMVDQSASYLSTVVLAPLGFTRPGYTFSSWATARDGSGFTFSDNGSFFVNMAADRVLYAQWAVSTLDRVSPVPAGLEGANQSVATNSQGEVFAVGVIPGAMPTDIGNGETLTGLSASFLFNGLLVKYGSQGRVTWARTITSAPSTYYASKLTEVSVDEDGNILAFGELAENLPAGLVGFGNGVGFTPSPDAYYSGFVVKYNGAGDALWAAGETTWQGTSYLAGTTDSAGNAYAAGYVDLGFGGQRSGLLSVYSPSGTLRFRKTVVSGPDTSCLTGVKIDAEGNLIVSGTLSRSGSYDFGSGIHVSGLNTGPDFFYETPFIAKLDSAGNTLWARSLLQVPGICYLGGITLDPSGNIVVDGMLRTKGSYSVGNGVSLTAGNAEGSPFLLKLSSAGSVLWAATASSESGYGRGEYTSVVLDSQGNIFAAGSKSGSLYFGNGITCPGPTSGTVPMLVKYDPQGNPVWVQANLSAPNMAYSAVCLDPSDLIYTVGPSVVEQYH